MTRTAGGLLDSLSFSRLNMRVRMVHPSLGTRAKLRFLPDGEFMECIVAELISPPPEVLVKLIATGEIFDSRTFGALGIELQFRRKSGRFENAGTPRYEEGAHSGRRRSARYSSTSAGASLRNLKQEKEVKDGQQVAMNWSAAENGKYRAKSEQKTEPVEEVVQKTTVKQTASRSNLVSDHTSSKQRRSTFNFSEDKGRKGNAFRFYSTF